METVIALVAFVGLRGVVESPNVYRIEVRDAREEQLAVEVKRVVDDGVLRGEIPAVSIIVYDTDLPPKANN
ncbi:MAG: hypothetical protein NZM35_09760 [Chitinophagales bacterium]|nr:hypothetical protein [Chitinophagales bacterium]MDW8419966.1 hypothetical protein [Chitinophagales bacterium]